MSQLTKAQTLHPATSDTPVGPITYGKDQLHRKLSAFGALLLTLSANSPVYAIYGFGPDLLHQVGSGAVALFTIAIAAAVIWAIIYAELGSAYPYAGGDYVGVGSILGAWAGIATLTIWAVSLGPLIAYLAKTIAPYIQDIFPTADARILTFGSLGAALMIAILGVRRGAFVTGVLFGLEMLTILALTIAGLWHPTRGLAGVLAHPEALSMSGSLAPVTFGAMALGGVTAAYATAGGQQAIPFGEELTEPHRHMGNVVLVAGLIGAVGTALPIIAVVLGAPDLPALLRSASPFSTFFSSVAGSSAGHALSAGVAVAVFNALIAVVMFSARLFFSLGRDELFFPFLNGMLSSVHSCGAPRGATLFIGAIAGACCLLDNHLLLVFLSGTIVFALTLASSAVLVGRPRGLTGQRGCWRSPLFPLAPILGLCIACAFALAQVLDVDVGRPSIILLATIIAVALLWHHWVLKRRVGGWAPRVE